MLLGGQNGRGSGGVEAEVVVEAGAAEPPRFYVARMARYATVAVRSILALMPSAIQLMPFRPHSPLPREATPMIVPRRPWNSPTKRTRASTTTARSI